MAYKEGTIFVPITLDKKEDEKLKKVAEEEVRSKTKMAKFLYLKGLQNYEDSKGLSDVQS